jgi:signal transduction histidine kinase
MTLCGEFAAGVRACSLAACLFAAASCTMTLVPEEQIVLKNIVWMPMLSDGTPDFSKREAVETPPGIHPLGEDRNPSWFQYEFELSRVPQAVQAIYFPGFYAQLELTLNGHMLATSGPRNAIPARGWRMQRLFEIPSEFLTAGTNTLLIRIGGSRAWTFGLPRIGTRDQLHRDYVMRLASTSVAPITIGVMMALLGLFVTILWIHQRSESLYGYFGVGTLLWGLHTVWSLIPYPPFPQPHERVIWTAMYTFWVSLLVIFFLRYTGKKWLRFTHGMWTFGLLGFPVLYAAAYSGAFGLASTIWRGVAVLSVLAALAITIRHAWDARRGDSILLMLTGIISAGFGVRDFLVALKTTTITPVWLVPYAGIAYMVLFGWLLVGRFNRNVESLENVYESLTARVAEKTRELADNFERLREAERQQSRLEERGRILRDMHDGLGTKLMISLRSLERGEIDNQAAAALVRDCIDELRLTVDAYDQTDGDLAGLLANLRYRLGDRLNAAGLEVEWKVAETPPIPVLERGGRELMRIIQEALNNVLKHARATKVIFETALEGDSVRVSLTDNGRGITTNSDTNHSPGHGLTDMRVRVEQLGGTLRVFNLGAQSDATVSGTEVRLRLPLRQA